MQSLAGRPAPHRPTPPRPARRGAALSKGFIPQACYFARWPGRRARLGKPSSVWHGAAGVHAGTATASTARVESPSPTTPRPARHSNKYHAVWLQSKSRRYQHEQHDGLVGLEGEGEGRGELDGSSSQMSRGQVASLLGVAGWGPGDRYGLGCTYQLLPLITPPPPPAMAACKQHCGGGGGRALLVPHWGAVLFRLHSGTETMGWASRQNTSPSNEIGKEPQQRAGVDPQTPRP